MTVMRFVLGGVQGIIEIDASTLTPHMPWKDDVVRRPRFQGVHRCACGSCDPRLRLSEERRNPGHFSVALDRSYGHLHVFHDDIEWPDVREVQTGRGGWASCISSPPHICPCGAKDVCCYLVYSDAFSVQGTA